MRDVLDKEADMCIMYIKVGTNDASACSGNYKLHETSVSYLSECTSLTL